MSSGSGGSGGSGGSSGDTKRGPQWLGYNFISLKEKRSRLCTIKEKHNATTCVYAHDYNSLVEHSSHKLSKTAQMTGDILVFDAQRKILMTVPFNQCYPTAFIRMIQDGKLQPNFSASMVVCKTWSTYGKCEQSSNCTFLHVDKFFLKQALSGLFWCSYLEGFASCPSKATCLYCHAPNDFKLPKDFVELATPPQPGSKSVVSKNRSEQVNLKYFAPTQGNTDAQCHTLCENQFCDKWYDCINLHLVTQFWDEVKTSLPPHFYVVQTQTPLLAPTPIPTNPLSVQINVTTPSPNITPIDVEKISYSMKTLNAPSQPPQTLSRIGSYRKELEMLFIPPPYIVKIPEKMAAALPKKRKALVDKRMARWSSRSPRYKAAYQHAFENTNSFRLRGSDREVCYLPSCVLSESRFSRVYLGLFADGSEIAVKIAKDTSTSTRTASVVWQKEVDMLKDLVGTPGMIRYLDSSEDFVENSETGEENVYRMIATELMEFNLEVLVGEWVKRVDVVFGTKHHILACQYILGSVLQTLLAICRHHHRREKHVDNNDDDWPICHDITPNNVQFDMYNQVHISDIDLDFTVSSSINQGEGGGVSSLQNTIPNNNSPSFNLCSIGKILHFISTGSVLVDSVEERQYRVFDAFPHKQYAIRHLIHTTCVEKLENLTFLNSSHSEKNFKINALELILSHPYFWDDRKAVSFLSTLGSMIITPAQRVEESAWASEQRADENLHNAILELQTFCLQIAFGGKSNYELRDHWQQHLRSSLTVSQSIHLDEHILRFIRNWHHHANRLPEAVNTPFLLHLFPQLVSSAWYFVLSNEILYSCYQLRPFINSTFQPRLDIPLDAHPDWF
jgi:hypothetical protein